mmetsp:Transcript_7871/g.23703  ORF Transcript_7871/g.23703 Transcript_7871/m.23703 type:complete len:209 (+) Transcript_7871:377-1003(+)
MLVRQRRRDRRCQVSLIVVAAANAAAGRGGRLHGCLAAAAAAPAAEAASPAIADAAVAAAARSGANARCADAAARKRRAHADARSGARVTQGRRDRRRQVFVVRIAAASTVAALVRRVSLLAAPTLRPELHAAAGRRSRAQRILQRVGKSALLARALRIRVGRACLIRRQPAPWPAVLPKLWAGLRRRQLSAHHKDLVALLLQRSQKG